jgi:hypothetical protein
VTGVHLRVMLNVIMSAETAVFLVIRMPMSAMLVHNLNIYPHQGIVQR